MLLGLTSRWMTPSACAWASALATWRAICTAVCTRAGPGSVRLSQSAAEPPRISRETMIVASGASRTS